MSTHPFTTLPPEWSFKDKSDLSLQKILQRLLMALRMKFKLLTLVCKILNCPISVFCSSFTNLLLWPFLIMLVPAKFPSTLVDLYSIPELTALCQHTSPCFIGTVQSTWISLSAQFLACKVNSFSSIKTQMKYHLSLYKIFSLYAGFPFVLPYHCRKKYAMLPIILPSSFTQQQLIKLPLCTRYWGHITEQNR